MRYANPITPRAALSHALFWGALCAIASVLVLPYLHSMIGHSADPALPFAVIALLTCLQSFIFMGCIAFLGTLAAHRVGLRAPFVEAWIARTQPPLFSKASFAHTVCIGLAGGVVLVLLDVVAFSPFMPTPHTPPPESVIAPWKGFLASFYGGIAEEVLLRLGLMSILVWMGHRMMMLCTKKSEYAHPSNALVWICIAIAAFFFGVGHLPAAAEIWDLTPIVILRILLLNASLALPLGWLYWKKGLEHAIVAHFSADLVLHVLLPILQKAQGA